MTAGNILFLCALFCFVLFFLLISKRRFVLRDIVRRLTCKGVTSWLTDAKDCKYASKLLKFVYRKCCVDRLRFQNICWLNSRPYLSLLDVK